MRVALRRVEVVMNERNSRHEIRNQLTVLDLVLGMLREQFPLGATDGIAMHDLLEAAGEAIARVRVLTDADVEAPDASPSPSSRLETTTFHIRL